MKKIILVRYGEIMLKGLNRPIFEDKLISNIKQAVYRYGKAVITKSQGRIYIDPQGVDYEFDEVMERLCKVFGIVSVSPVFKTDSDFQAIKEQSLLLMRDVLGKMALKNTTFKVEAKRGDKGFPMDSPEICRELGACILEGFPCLSVDVHNPDITVFVEVREHTYIYSEILKACGGMPTGTNGKATLLLSGGIDSPVAGWMIAKRGVELDAVHFYSYPYTSERAKEKVIELARILARYCFRIDLHIVPFTAIQEEISSKCPQDQMTVIMRRVMMSVAEKLACASGSLALVTGESIGQVASQTIHSLAVTNAAVEMPVFRPLIGMDKNDTISIARRIGTYETSILPYEDCCTVFVAKHPRTKPRITDIKRAEEVLDLDGMIGNAADNTEVMRIKD